MSSGGASRYASRVHWGDVPAWVAAAIAALAAFLSWRSSRKSKDAQDEANKQAGIATQAAVDAADAESRAADAAVRSAGALEQQTQHAIEQADAAESVPWRVEHRKGAKWQLWNDSAYPKFKVRISGPGITQRRTPDEVERIDGRSSFEFWGNTSWGAEQRVDVAWHQLSDGQDEPRTWSAPMPPAR